MRSMTWIPFGGFCLLVALGLCAGSAVSADAAKEAAASTESAGYLFALDLSSDLKGVWGFGPHNLGELTLVEEDCGKAIRFELRRYMGEEGKREVKNCGIAFCGIRGWEGNDGKAAMSFEPATDYIVEFEAKGSLKKVDIIFKSFPENFDNDDYWQGQKGISAVPAFFSPKEEWQKYSARFRTRHDTSRGGIALQLWCSEKEGGLTLKPGEALFIRSCIIRKVEPVEERIDIEAE